MIYVDTSNALAFLLGERRAPPASFWTSKLISSQLLEYEIWTRLHAYHATELQFQKASELLDNMYLADLLPVTLIRIKHAFPMPVKTLDAIHLATFFYLKEHHESLMLASYDKDMNEAAKLMGFQLCEL